MTAYSGPSAYDIGNAVANQINPKLSAIESQLMQISQHTSDTATQARLMLVQLEAIKAAQLSILAEMETMRRMGIARARAQSQLAADKLKVIAFEMDEKKYELDLQKNAVQGDYDKSQLEFIGNFAESVSADTKSIDEIKDEYGFISQMMKDATDDSKAMTGLHMLSLKERMKAMRDRKEEVLNNLRSFLSTRKGTVEQISDLQNKIEQRQASVIFIPFWVVGLRSGHRERQLILPIMERTAPAIAPTRNAPYVEHLVPHKGHPYSGYVSLFEKKEIIELAKRNPVQKFSPNRLDELASYFDRTEPDGGSAFLKAIRRFVFKR